MSTLSKPRHRFVDPDLADARSWCHGHTTDDKAAPNHALRIAPADALEAGSSR